ncbi:MAG TPA: hypothetical protein VIQ24_01885, partial [Pyrinomonadaceae bacterium]
MKVSVGDAARARRGDEFEFGIVDKERGRRVGGGRGVDDVAAERAAILDGDAARLARRRRFNDFSPTNQRFDFRRRWRKYL